MGIVVGQAYAGGSKSPRHSMRWEAIQPANEADFFVEGNGHGECPTANMFRLCICEWKAPLDQNELELGN